MALMASQSQLQRHHRRAWLPVICSLVKVICSGRQHKITSCMCGEKRIVPTIALVAVVASTVAAVVAPIAAAAAADAAHDDDADCCC